MFPRFDKGLHGGQGDREADFEEKECDLLIFEGWFNGFRQIQNDKLSEPGVVSSLVNDDYKLFDVNNSLLKQYERIWDLFDELLVIKPESYTYSYQWREDAERQLGKGMDTEEIKRFVQYFMNCLPQDVYFDDIVARRDKYKNNLILEISKKHKIVNIF